MTRPLLRLDHAARLLEADLPGRPLVLVGTRRPDGSPHIESVSLGAPLGRTGRFCVVSPARGETDSNATRTGIFTASYVMPDDLPDEPADIRTLDGDDADAPLVAGARGAAECRLEHVVRGGGTAILVGDIVTAWAAPGTLTGRAVFRRPLISYGLAGRRGRRRG